MEIFGYFDSPEQDRPAYDPGLDTICPHCLRDLNPTAVTISLMKPGDSRSYFYRAHKACHEAASADDVCIIESSLIDGITP